MSALSRKQQTQKRHRRLRRNLSGTAARPRLAVFRSNNHIYAQVIDDVAQSTLCSASPLTKPQQRHHRRYLRCRRSRSAGRGVLGKGIQSVVFDRGVASTPAVSRPG